MTTPPVGDDGTEGVAGSQSAYGGESAPPANADGSQTQAAPAEQPQEAPVTETAAAPAAPDAEAPATDEVAVTEVPEEEVAPDVVAAQEQAAEDASARAELEDDEVLVRDAEPDIGGEGFNYGAIKRPVDADAVG